MHSGGRAQASGQVLEEGSPSPCLDAQNERHQGESQERRQRERAPQRPHKQPVRRGAHLGAEAGTVLDQVLELMDDPLAAGGSQKKEDGGAERLPAPASPRQKLLACECRMWHWHGYPKDSEEYHGGGYMHERY